MDDCIANKREVALAGEEFQALHFKLGNKNTLKRKKRAFVIGIRLINHSARYRNVFVTRARGKNLDFVGASHHNASTEEKKQNQLVVRTLKLMKKHYLLAGLVVSTVVLSASNVLADSALTIFGKPTSTVVTYDNASGAYPVITAVLSQPGTLDGYTYSSWSILAADSTGSLDLFGALPGGTSFTPAAGEAISVSGTYSPYHQIPEVGTLTALSLISSGNAVSSPGVFTVPQLTASGTGPIPQNIAGQLVALDSVSLYTDSAATIPVSGNFATHANTALYAKDGGGNIMEIYVWASSYSTCGAMGGTPIPTGVVDITGFMSQSGTFSPEMTPFSITPAPEPTTLSLCGGGLLLALVFHLRRKD